MEPAIAHYNIPCPKFEDDITLAVVGSLIAAVSSPDDDQAASHIYWLPLCSAFSAIVMIFQPKTAKDE